MNIARTKNNRTLSINNFQILENKKNSLIDSLPEPTEEIIEKRIKKLEQKIEKEVDNALKKIKTSIEEILSIDTPKTGKII